VHASAVEIYCERIRDLLCFSQSSDNLSVQQVGHGCIRMVQWGSMRFGGRGQWGEVAVVCRSWQGHYLRTRRSLRKQWTRRPILCTRAL